MAERVRVAELVALIDRLEGLMERSALSELELEAEGTTVLLRTPAALAGPVGTEAPGMPGAELPAGPTATPGPDLDEVEPVGARAHLIVAPLTGVYYRSPSPGAEPYVREGGQVNAGQVIGLIEAMKLFNEIKSDVTGTVRRLAAGDGELVKVRQLLIEVDPA